MSTTTTDPQAPAPSRFGKDWDDKMAELVAEHEAGQHGPKNSLAGCPGACPSVLLARLSAGRLLSGALDEPIIAGPGNDD